MALNPAYEAIGKSFVEQYYLLFDDVNQRPNLANLYNVSRQFSPHFIPFENDLMILIYLRRL